MHRITKVQVHPAFILELTFADGTRGRISLADRLFGPMFESLRDPARFAEATIDEFGAVCWSNGADLAPDALYQQIKSSTQAA